MIRDWTKNESKNATQKSKEKNEEWLKTLVQNSCKMMGLNAKHA